MTKKRKFPFVMYRPLPERGKYTETLEVIHDREEETAALREGCKYEPDHHSRHRKQLEDQLIAQDAKERAEAKYWSDHKSEAWSILWKELPDYLKTRLPEQYSENNAVMLEKMLGEPEPLPELLVIEESKAKEIAKEFDSVPQRYREHLQVYYSAAERKNRFESPEPGAVDRLRLMLKELCVFTELSEEKNENYWLDLLRCRTSSKKSTPQVDLSVGGRAVGGDDVVINDVFGGLATIIRSAANHSSDEKAVASAINGQLRQLRVSAYDDIKGALAKDDRKRAVSLWGQMRETANKTSTHSALYRRARQHKTEFYKWLSGKLPQDSAAGRAFGVALTTDW